MHIPETHNKQAINAKINVNDLERYARIVQMTVAKCQRC